MLDLLLASDTRSFVQDWLVVILILVALIWGAAPERAAITIWVICIELPTIVYRVWLGADVSLDGLDLYLAAKDFAAGLLWIALALYANRNYALWIAGTQLLAMGSHVARGLVEAISPIGYAFLVVAPGWIILIIMAVGFTRHGLRRRKYGPYRDWRIVRKAPDFGTIPQNRNVTFPLGASGGSAKDKTS